MRRWLTILVFVMALAMPAFAQSNSSNTQQPGQAGQSSQGGGSSSKQTSTSTTTSKTSTPVETTTGIDPLYLAIGGIALITIIAIALLAARSRRNRDTVAVRESTTVIKE
ncbi:MAG: hypothetical protein LC731_06490 [Acidobacteria bacterium]|nr:hypothetical protein [Acidobacteriota bacterium]